MKHFATRGSSTGQEGNGTLIVTHDMEHAPGSGVYTHVVGAEARQPRVLHGLDLSPEQSHTPEWLVCNQQVGTLV
jgi:hypothetical protein